MWGPDSRHKPPRQTILGISQNVADSWMQVSCQWRLTTSPGHQATDEAQTKQVCLSNLSPNGATTEDRTQCSPAQNSSTSASAYSGAKRFLRLPVSWSTKSALSKSHGNSSRGEHAAQKAVQHTIIQRESPFGMPAIGDCIRAVMLKSSSLLLNNNCCLLSTIIVVTSNLKQASTEVMTL